MRNGVASVPGAGVLRNVFPFPPQKNKKQFTESMGNPWLSRNETTYLGPFMGCGMEYDGITIILPIKKMEKHCVSLADLLLSL